MLQNLPYDNTKIDTDVESENIVNAEHDSNNDCEFDVDSK